MVEKRAYAQKSEDFSLVQSLTYYRQNAMSIPIVPEEGWFGQPK